MYNDNNANDNAFQRRLGMLFITSLHTHTTHGAPQCMLNYSYNDNNDNDNAFQQTLGMRFTNHHTDTITFRLL